MVEDRARSGSTSICGGPGYWLSFLVLYSLPPGMYNGVAVGDGDQASSIHNYIAKGTSPEPIHSRWDQLWDLGWHLALVKLQILSWLLVTGLQRVWGGWE